MKRKKNKQPEEVLRARGTAKPATLKNKRGTPGAQKRNCRVYGVPRKELEGLDLTQRREKSSHLGGAHTNGTRAIRGWFLLKVLEKGLPVWGEGEPENNYFCGIDRPGSGREGKMVISQKGVLPNQRAKRKNDMVWGRLQKGRGAARNPDV